MKVVLNRCFGGFSVSENAMKDLSLDSAYDLNDDRMNDALIQLIKDKGSEYVSGLCAQLKVMNIPKKATDWQIDNYDGAETLLIVVDGKIKRL